MGAKMGCRQARPLRWSRASTSPPLFGQLPNHRRRKKKIEREISPAFLRFDFPVRTPRGRGVEGTAAMSVPEAGQSAGRDERERDEYEQQQARVLMALMQGFCAARYRKADNTPCPIDQGLYLGSVGAAMNKEALKSLNITHILIVARSLNPTYPAEFTYKKIEGGHEDRHEKGPKTFARCIDGGEAGYYHCPNAARTNAAIDACPHYVICNMAGVNGNRTTVEIHKSRRRRWHETSEPAHEHRGMRKMIHYLSLVMIYLLFVATHGYSTSPYI